MNAGFPAEHAEHYKPNADDPEKAEYFVRVAWLDTVPDKCGVRGGTIWQSEHRLPAHDTQVAAYCGPAQDALPQMGPQYLSVKQFPAVSLVNQTPINHSPPG